MRSLLVLLAGVTACEFKSQQIGSAARGEVVTVRLEAHGETGRLQRCDEHGCESYDNPEGCAVLEIRIDTSNGSTCETCEDPSGRVIREGCGDQTAVECAVITLPNPDCVICAYRDGPVIYNDCTPNADCYAFTEVVDGTSRDCRACYDASGNEVSSSCTGGCSCRPISCPAGYALVTSPGDCCPYCAPASGGACSERVCAQDVALPDCPPGTTLARDPNDCCRYYCQQTDCSTFAPEPAGGCPPGWYYDASYPSCGRCIEDPAAARYCYSDADCLPDEICTTSQGGCIEPEPCGANGCAGFAGCGGTCRPRDVTCGDQPAYTAWYCEGQWVTYTDANGCALPPECVCPDGTYSADGRCPDPCANVRCAEPPPTCGSDEIAVPPGNYPMCCGGCEPRDPCAGVMCPQVACGAGYRTVHYGCCPSCEREPGACFSSSDCLAGEVCESERTDCANSLEGCRCVPAQSCTDSDGYNPSVAGYVYGYGGSTDPSTGAYRYDDVCSSSTQVIEHTCYAPVQGSAQQSFQRFIVDCPNGCREGACIQ